MWLRVLPKQLVPDYAGLTSHKAVNFGIASHILGNVSRSITTRSRLPPLKLPREPGGRVLRHEMRGPKRDETDPDALPPVPTGLEAG